MANATQFGETEADKRTKRMLSALERYGNAAQTDQVEHGDRFVIPKGMSPGEAATHLQRIEESLEATTDFEQVYDYRPYDGAYALQKVLRQAFGTAGTGVSTWFGMMNPDQISVPIGLDEKVQVIWGVIQFAPINGLLNVGSTTDKHKGDLFKLFVRCPKKFERAIQGLFKLVEEELKAHSIYKGKAVNGAMTPEFIDVHQVRRNQVVYSDEVETQLAANIWSLPRHTKIARKLGLPLKRAVLLSGAYGTGKSLAAVLTAQECVANDWTFILCRPGLDDLKTTMATAMLYQPACVFFEDVDAVANPGEPERVSKLLDAFDGVTAKGTELMVVLTTNHPERIHRGMLRPGRLDAVITIAGLDTNGIERLIKSKVSEEMLGEMDYDAIGKSMQDFLPAFVAEAIDRATRYAIARTGAIPENLVTEDFVEAANGLRPQLDQMNGAGENADAMTIEDMIAKVIDVTVNGAKAIDRNGTPILQLTTSDSVPALYED
jgi:transitional endoplasmic reticulum ATPase